MGKSVLALSVVAVGGTVGCGGGEPPVCGSTGLTAAETTMRTQVGYLDHAQDPARACRSCQLYVAGASATACGTCALNLGAVGPGATCNSFVAKTS